MTRWDLGVSPSFFGNGWMGRGDMGGDMRESIRSFPPGSVVKRMSPRNGIFLLVSYDTALHKSPISLLVQGYRSLYFGISLPK